HERGWPCRHGVADVLHGGVVVQGEPEQYVAVGERHVRRVANVHVVDADAGVGGGIRELRECTHFGRERSGEEDAELLRELYGVVLRAWLCFGGARVRHDDHRRHGWDGRKLQGFASGAVARLPNGLQSGERVAVQLEQAPEGRELQELVMPGAACEPRLPREAWNAAVKCGGQRGGQRCRHHRMICTNAWNDFFRTRRGGEPYPWRRSGGAGDDWRAEQRGAKQQRPTRVSNALDAVHVCVRVSEETIAHAHDTDCLTQGTSDIGEV